MMRPIRLAAGRQAVSLAQPSAWAGQGCMAVRAFSVLDRPPPKYKGHVPLTLTEKAGLALGSAFGAFLNPRRADLIALLGEVTVGPVAQLLRDAMLADPTGREILRERPRINSETLPLEKLLAMPKGTVGHTYGYFRQRYHMSPDVRDTVRYVDDAECAYVVQRYRECHDFYHAILGLPPQFVEGEIALKAFEFVNTGLPMAALSLVAVARLSAAERKRFFTVYLPWAMRSARDSKPIMNVYWEKELETDVEVLLKRLGVTRPPDMHALRRKAKKATAPKAAAPKAEEAAPKAP